MIRVTPISGEALLLNPDLIEAIETTPDTVLIFASGRRMVVGDSPADLADRIAQFRASVLARVEALSSNRRPRRHV